MRRSLLIPAFFLSIGCLALLVHGTEWGYTHLWALRPTAGAYWFYWILGIAAWIAVYRSADRPVPADSQARRVLGFGRWSSLMLWGLLLGSAILLLFQFRQRLFLAPPDGLGDSLLILEQVPVYTHLRGYLDSFDELLELYWHSRLYLFTSESFSWHVEDAYALLSIASFALYGTVVFYFLIRRSLFEILAGLALLIFVPALQLFAGYVEHYTIATSWMALSILTGAYALERKGRADAPPIVLSVVIVAACAAAAVLHHSIVTVILPALVYLVVELAGGKARNTVRLGLIAAATALPILFGVWAWFLFFAEPPLAFSDSHISSPPVHRPSELFLPAHLRDMLNLFFIASPAAILIFLICTGGEAAGANPVAKAAAPAVVRLRRPLAWCAPEPVQFFLLLATLGLGGIAFIIESLIGFPADWDLLTIFQFPLNLYLFYRARFAWGENQAARRLLHIALPFVLIMHGFITTSWIARNAEQTAVSLQNVELARRNVAESLQILRQDPIYAKVARVYPDRQKTYIQVKLFFIRSRNRLLSDAGDFSRAERESLGAALGVGEADFHAWMQMPREDFETRYDPLWKALSDLNVRINASE